MLSWRATSIGAVSYLTQQPLLENRVPFDQFTPDQHRKGIELTVHVHATLPAQGLGLNSGVVM